MRKLFLIFICILFIYIPFIYADLTDDLVAYYDFEDSSGGLTDSSGMGNDLFENLSPTYSVPGILGDAVLFDATAGEFFFRNATDLNGNWTDLGMTISLWINKSTLTQNAGMIELGWSVSPDIIWSITSPATAYPTFRVCNQAGS